MHLSKKVLGIGASVTACAACCAIPVLGPAVAAVGFAGLGTAAAGLGTGLVALLIAMTVGVIIVRRRVSSSTCATAIGPACTSRSCGCSSMPTNGS